MITKEDSLVHKLNFILNKIPFAVLLEDSNRRLQFTNQNFCQLFNIEAKPEQMVGFNCAEAAEIVAPLFKNPEEFLNRIDEILEKKVAVNQEVIELANGKVFLRDYLPIFNDEVFEGQVWIYYDYTSTRRMEYENIRHKEFYERILHNIPADIAVFDKNHRYTFVNKIAIKDDIIREWIIGKDDFEYIQLKEKDINIAKVRRALFNTVIQEKNPQEFVEENIKKDGEVQFNLRRMQPFFTEQGEVDYVVGYGMDITSIKKAEEYIRRKEQNFAQIPDMLSIVVVIIDKALNIVFANSSFESVFGYPPSEIIGKKIEEIALSDMVSIRRDIELYETNAITEDAPKEFQFKDKYGSTKYLTYSLMPYERADVAETNYALFFNDVTDQHLAVSELQKIIEKERRLNELKSGFVNIVSHEMRTPLSVIQSSAQILELLNGADRITKELLTLHTNRIVSEVGGMENLMEELLLVSKIESGKIEFKPFPQNLSSFVKTLLFERYSPYNDGRYMRLEERGTLRELAFDRVMMQHILNNVINNAFKYSSGRKPPVIRLRYGINKISIIVMDFGIGIPEKDRQNLFKAFSRASNVDGIKGTGLGLLVVKYFLEFHQAKLRFKTKVNTGTCIIIDMIENPALDV